MVRGTILLQGQLASELLNEIVSFICDAKCPKEILLPYTVQSRRRLVQYLYQSLQSTRGVSRAHRLLQLG
ncbi:hypothetical protein ACLBR7_30105, partial [Klebsiella pneumoniae]|uniref:hypothetical protein n=1 Tax=Klebsiella pneumoniae TaxID=573 RepID=UPI0039692DBC